MRVETSRYVFTSPAVVWEELTDWERQPEWMVDAHQVEVVGEQRQGVGVRLRCRTDLLGCRSLPGPLILRRLCGRLVPVVDDRMEVTGWEEQVRLEVRHLGKLITGRGVFELAPTGVGTRVVWHEDVALPWGGSVGEVAVRAVVRPWLARLFGRSLDELKRRCERTARRRAVSDGEPSAG